MIQPIWVLSAGDDPALAMSGEVLRGEGFPWFEQVRPQDVRSVPEAVRVLVCAGQGIHEATARSLARAVAAGRSLIALVPAPALAAQLGVWIGSPVMDARVCVGNLTDWEHGALPLLCPDDLGAPLQGGREVAVLRGADGARQGAAIVEVRVGKGRAWMFGYDLCRTVATLRHGTGQLDERPQRDMGPLYGPRHIYGFFELSDKLPRDVPVSDLHQDILRSLLRAALADTALPRLWHFPNAAPALWFVKGDGCGEQGADFLVDLVERYGAYLTFYRPLHSRYPGGLMREWHRRGHGISVEVDITGVTQYTEERDGRSVRHGRSVAQLNSSYLGAIRSVLEEHRDTFLAETELRMDTICVHGCQWTGLPMAEMVLELGWHTPTHFISHDPRMRRDSRYGPYMIATGLPLRYFERGVGVLDLWHMPAQWDESQTIGRHQELLAPPVSMDGARVDGMVGLTAEEYGVELVRFAESAAKRWHVVQIANFHPIYVAMDQSHPRASRKALELALDGARSAGCQFSNLEDWSRFFRARANVRLTTWQRHHDSETVGLTAGDPIRGLTLLLPERVAEVRDGLTGRGLPMRLVRLEEKEQHALAVDLRPGSELLLHLRTRSRFAADG